MSFPHDPKSEDNPSRVNEAVDLYFQNRFQEALELLNSEISDSPENKYAFYNRALAETALGHVESAINDYSAAIDIAERTNTIAADTVTAWALTNRAILRKEAGLLDEAMGDYDRAVELEPSAKHIYNRGTLFFQLGKEKEALAAYDMAIALDATIPEFHFNRALCNQNLGRLQAALDDCDACEKLRPEDARAYHVRAHVLDTLGRIYEAKRAYKQFLSLADKRRDRHLIAATRKRLGTIWKS